MARPPSVEGDTLERLLTAYAETGSKAAAARRVGIPLSTAKRYLQGTRKAAAPVVAVQQAMIERSGASLWDTRGALDENYARLLRLVDQFEKQVDAANPMPAAVYLSTLKEIREHVTVGIKLAALMVDIQEVREFQRAVIEAVGEADDQTRERILGRLQERRAVGLAVGWT